MTTKIHHEEARRSTKILIGMMVKTTTKGTKGTKGTKIARIDSVAKLRIINAFGPSLIIIAQKKLNFAR